MKNVKNAKKMQKKKNVKKDKYEENVQILI